ncbi:unnamed protein product [Linum tenue]|uniref:Uncharacterized protein n=1 Tax=Linum tenue TaxID=586396 RepID=A0AAV0NMA9_9ROSI|nr:unnamed protein product [Linum tenue]
MLQFSKRIIPRGVRVTLVNTRFISKTIANSSSSASACSTTIHLATISDGFDDSGFAPASMDAYCSTFQRVGSRTLTQLVADLRETEYPATCIIYDHLIPWCLDVAKSFGLITAAFFTQSCAVESIYYHVREGLLHLPVVEAQISIPGLPPLEARIRPL